MPFDGHKIEDLIFGFYKPFSAIANFNGPASGMA